jgi:uncharacterized protein YbjT (DUF2867 family)
VRADVDDEQSVARAMEGADVAYYLVHSLGQAGFEERERRSADGFARAAEKSGLHQIVYLGGLGDDADDLSPHLRSRRETEQRLAARSVPVTTLRASMVIGEGSAAFETIAALVDRPACDDPSALGQNADTADCARRRRPFISPESAQTRTYSGRPMTLAGPRS